MKMKRGGDAEKEEYKRGSLDLSEGGSRAREGHEVLNDLTGRDVDEGAEITSRRWRGREKEEDLGHASSAMQVGGNEHVGGSNAELPARLKVKVDVLLVKDEE